MPKHIAIVGAGLVGSLLSIYLRKRGYDIAVFERRADVRVSIPERGRSINLALSNRGIRALEEVGLAEEIKKVAIPMHGRMMHDVHGNLSFLAYGKQGQYINSISRTQLNTVLINKASKLGVKFLFEHRCSQVDTANSTVTTQSGQETKDTRFDLVIGADGAFSTVRSALQFTDRFDFSQDYIDHGYRELQIPAGANDSFQLEKNALHIWPRESYMLIALPNPDGSFTCTLFFPFDGPLSFATLKSDQDVKHFFERVFPDALRLIPDLVKQWLERAASSLVTMKCHPWSSEKVFLIGDAAHAIVPFFGQGMNAGFEDCRILNQLLDERTDDWGKVIPEFERHRKPDADAIAELALANFTEMRDLVADAGFLLRKKIEAKLHDLYPEKWIPLYSMVTFRDDIRYSEAYRVGQKQKMIMDEVMSLPGIRKNWETIDFGEIVRRLEKDSGY